MIKLDLGENLQLLCSFEHSVSDACRAMGINRQQFSKYLNGTSKPSARNLNKICNYFSVHPSDLYLPQDQFSHSEAVEKRRTRLTSDISSGPAYREAFNGHGKNLKPYLGYYLVYFYSFSWDQLIICALTRLENVNGQICTKTVERSRDPASNALFLSKYDGQAAFLGNRIFLSEYQSSAKDAIVETVLFPKGRGQLTYLQGVTFGISSHKRNPYMARTVFQYLGSNVDLRAAMKAVGLHARDSGKINPYILNLLGEPDVTSAQTLEEVGPR